MQLVRGLLRFFVVGFTVLSLLLVAAVGVAATSGKDGSANPSANALKHSVVALFSGHSDQTGAQEGTNGSTDTNKGKDNGKEKKECKEEKHHEHATKGHKHHPCGEDDSG